MSVCHYTEEVEAVEDVQHEVQTNGTRVSWWLYNKRDTSVDTDKGQRIIRRVFVEVEKKCCW